MNNKIFNEAIMAVPPVDFPSLSGVWRRRWIRRPDRREDSTTRVFWLQGEQCYADIRIGTPRPAFDGVSNLTDCNAAQRQWLTTQEGFAGTLHADGDAWRWDRELDYQPPTGNRDIGRL